MDVPFKITLTVISNGVFDLISFEICQIFFYHRNHKEFDKAFRCFHAFQVRDISTSFPTLNSRHQKDLVVFNNNSHYKKSVNNFKMQQTNNGRL